MASPIGVQASANVDGAAPPEPLLSLLAGVGAEAQPATIPTNNEARKTDVPNFFKALSHSKLEFTHRIQNPKRENLKPAKFTPQDCNTARSRWLASLLKVCDPSSSGI